MAEKILQNSQYFFLIQFLIFLTIYMNQRAFFATTETMCAMVIHQVPEVVFGKILLNHFHESFIAPRKA